MASDGFGAGLILEQDITEKMPCPCAAGIIERSPGATKENIDPRGVVLYSALDWFFPYNSRVMPAVSFLPGVFYWSLAA